MKKFLILLFVSLIAFPSIMSAQDLDAATLAKRAGRKNLTIKEWNTAWVKFQAGEIDGIGIDVTIADDYKNSDRAYFTPDDFVASLQLQSSKEGLKAREEAGIDKEILANVKFRKITIPT